MRNRGTALVETEAGILITLEGHGQELLLPGGGVEAGESGLEAAIRELREETGLIAEFAIPLFRFQSRYNQYFVCYIRASGRPHLGHEVKYLGGYRAGGLTPLLCQPGYEPMSVDDVSLSTRAIIHLYRQQRRERSLWFETLDGLTPLPQYTYDSVDGG